MIQPTLVLSLVAANIHCRVFQHRNRQAKSVLDPSIMDILLYKEENFIKDSGIHRLD